MNSEEPKTKDSEPKKKRKSPFRWLLLLIPIIVGAIFFIETILSKTLTKQLENAGLQLGSIRVTSAGMDGIDSIQVSDLEFPPEWALSGVTIDLADLAISYNLKELFKTKKLDEVTFKSLNLSIDLDEFTLPESQETTGDYRDIPQTIFASLPDAYPFQNLDIENGSLTLIKNHKLLAALPFQLTFNEAGKLKLQSSKLQLNATYNKKMGHAVVNLQYQLQDFPGVLTPLVQDSANIPELNGVSITGNLAIANQQFQDASLFVNVASASTTYGNLSGSTLHLNCSKDLSLRNLSINTDYSELKYTPVSAESGRIELNVNVDAPSTFSFKAKGGSIQHVKYQDFLVSSHVKNTTMETNGELFISGETIPWKTSIKHPIFGKLQEWVKTPNQKIPELPDPKEILNALTVDIGPVILKENEQIDLFLEGIPDALISGEISIHRKAGERIAQIDLKDGVMDLPDSGVKISGIQYSGRLSDKPSLRTIESSTMEIETMQLGDLSLKNGELPIAISTNVDSNPVIIMQGTNFDTLGGKISLGLTSVEINGADTTATARIDLSGIQTEEILQFANDFPIEMKGELEGQIHLVYKPSGATLSNSHLSVKPETRIVVKYDAKERFSKHYKKDSPEWVQMRRIETLLKEIDVSAMEIRLDPDHEDPTEILHVLFKANHKSNENDVGLQGKIELWDSEGDAAVKSSGTLSLFGHDIPWNLDIQHPKFSEVSRWLHNPSPEELPKLPDNEEMIQHLALQAGPLQLKESSLLNALIPGLPETFITGKITASRKKGENAVQIDTNFSKMSVPEQELILSNITTSPLIGWGSSVYTINPASLNIGKISVQKLELHNGELPWSLNKEGILHTPGCKFETLGGSIMLGGTALELKGSETMTTGLLTMENIDFEKILALAEKPPLQLKGVFNGQLPFLFNMDKLEPAKGGFLQMKSMTTGHLEYDAQGRFTQNQKPGSRAWKNMDLAERALKNLNISGITLHFLPEEDPQLPLRAVIKGSHQTDRQKINLELTLNLRGDIEEILQKAAQGNLELVP